MPSKPRYVPKPDARPQVASTPHQSINAPFRNSRKILSKKVLQGGSIIYHLGAFLPSANSADHAVPDIIQVPATSIDDHVSYEELERFEHEEFESELARELAEIQKLERRQTRDLLRGSFKRGRGRPKKNQGLLSPLGLRRGRLLGHANSDVDADSGETESEISSTDVEGIANNNPFVSGELSLIDRAGTVRSDRWRVIDSKKTAEKRFEQVRVEIPIRATEKERTAPKSVVERNKPKAETSVVRNRLELIDSFNQRSPKGNATSSNIGSFRSILGSSRDGGKVTIKSDEGPSYKTKSFKHDLVASSTTQQSISIASVTPTIIKAVSTASRKERSSSPESTNRGRHTPVDQPRRAPDNARNFFQPKILDPNVISDEESDDEDGKDFFQSTKISQPKRSTHPETGLRPEKAITTSTDPKSSNKDHHEEHTSDADSDGEVDILLSRFASNDRNLNPLTSRSFTHHDFSHRHQSSKLSKPATVSSLNNVQCLNHPQAPAFPSSNPSKHPTSSPAFIPDTDSEDDLAAGEQLLQEFEGEKTRAIDTADSLLRQFQKQPLKRVDPSSSTLKSSAHKESSKPSKNYKILTSSSSNHHGPSMTAPFPSGKPIRRSIPSGAKIRTQTGVSKIVVPPSESENDSSTKKRKRDKHVGQWRTVRLSDDSEAEWSPRG